MPTKHWCRGREHPILRNNIRKAPRSSSKESGITGVKELALGFGLKDEALTFSRFAAAALAAAVAAELGVEGCLAEAKEPASEPWAPEEEPLECPLAGWDA